MATCQILIRYDAYARTFEGTPMMEYYMKQVTKHPTAFRKLWQHQELNALADSFQTMEEMQQERKQREELLAGGEGDSTISMATACRQTF